jgi:hypothetical protein
LVLPSANDKSDKRLRLSSKAVLLNDIENMQVTSLYCIVGFPNISKFASVTDPILTRNDVNEFLNQLRSCEMYGDQSSGHGHPSVMSNSIITQAMPVQRMLPSNSSSNNSQDDDDDDSKGDLHLYRFGDVLLKKKERLILPIFDVELPYRDVYHCRIRGSMLARGYSHSSSNEQYEEVRFVGRPRLPHWSHDVR